METIAAWDRSLFLLINHLPHTWMTDSLALFFSGIGQIGAIWLVIAGVLFYREEKKDHIFFIPITAALGMAVMISEWFIKTVIARPRPDVHIGAVIISQAANYSFPSTHATLAFAGAYVMSRTDPKNTRIFFILASCIAVSRIYLGVHYPIDVVGGICLGIMVGYAAVGLEKYARRYLGKHNNKRKKR